MNCNNCTNIVPIVPTVTEQLVGERGIMHTLYQHQQEPKATPLKLTARDLPWIKTETPQVCKTNHNGFIQSVYHS